MIRQSNGHEFEYVLASGSMGFDAKGWFWEKLLIWLGFIQLKLFTVVLRTLTKEPRPYPVSNFSWIRPWTWLPFCPWSCVRLISGGVVNKIGLWNPGFDYWFEKIAPTIDFENLDIVISIFGNEQELLYMVERLNTLNIKAIEVNPSCSNTRHAKESVATIVRYLKSVKAKSLHPIWLKLSVDQAILEIVSLLVGVVEVIELNSVPWKIAFPNGEQSPLHRLEKKIGGDVGSTTYGGGVSGRPAQLHNHQAVIELVQQGLIPVVCPSIMNFWEMFGLRVVGVKAFAFGAIHLPSHPFWLYPWTLFTNPCKPTSFVKKENRSREQMQGPSDDQIYL